MAITIEIPWTLEESLRKRISNLDGEAKELLLADLYRRDLISHHELASALGLSWYETEGVLKKHHVVEDLPTIEELEQECEAAKRRARSE